MSVLATSHLAVRLQWTGFADSSSNTAPSVMRLSAASAPVLGRPASASRFALVLVVNAINLTHPCRDGRLHWVIIAGLDEIIIGTPKLSFDHLIRFRHRCQENERHCGQRGPHASDFVQNTVTVQTRHRNTAMQKIRCYFRQEFQRLVTRARGEGAIPGFL